MSKLYKSTYYESEELDEIMYLPVTLDDGTELECEVLAIFPVNVPVENSKDKQERQYIALLPVSEEETDIFLYRFVPVGSEEFKLEGIEGDEEYEAVADVFDMLLDDAEFDALAEEETTP